ncbi:MAG: DUF6056 family protein [Blautia sp.]|nr:DUF6056 family protein [Blautia sp.]MCM1200918.1 DUF6056 family protein [Bacteroides fragilis]
MNAEKVRKNYQKITDVLKRCGMRTAAAVNGISMKKMAVCAAVLFVLSILPLLLLGRYNVMCIDDYNYGMRVHDTWMATGSLGQSIRTAAAQTKEFFIQWQGTYISCFLMAVCPMNFRYDAAFVVPVIMIGLFAVSVFLFGRQILVNWLGSDGRSASFVMFLLLFMFYQIMEAPFEGIYWYNGATHYVLMESLLFLMLTLVSGILWTEDKRAVSARSFPAALLGVIVGGGNLVTALQAEILLFFLLVFAYAKKREKTFYVLLPFLTFTAGFLCNVLAPGNAVRAGMDTDVGYPPVAAVALSFYYAVVFIIGWTNAFAILIWLALWPVLWQIGKRSDKNFAHPVWVTAGAFCILSAMFTPTLYAVGMVGLSRVDNIIQMVYYLCLFFVTAYWFGWISRRRGAETGEKMQAGGDKGALSAGEVFGSFLEKTGNMMTAVCVVLVLLVWTLTADKNTYTGISALRSLVNGDAAAYYEEAMERHALYVDETAKEIVVKPFSVRPALFDFEDLTPDADNWLNLAVADYYHKNSVRRE